MSAYIVFKYVHLLAVITMVCCLSVELALIKPFLLRNEIKRLSRVDALYGLAAIVAVGAGLTLWFGVGKGSAFYDNPVLHFKVALVILVGLLSIMPTVYFIRNAKGDQEASLAIPPGIRRLIIFQLFLLAVVPLLASLMANGFRF